MTFSIIAFDVPIALTGYAALSVERQITDVPDVKLNLFCHLRHLHLKLVAHVVLLLLVAGENADFSDVGLKEAVQNRIAKRAGPPFHFLNISTSQRLGQRTIRQVYVLTVPLLPVFHPTLK
jgi:hypothetical protein